MTATGAQFSRRQGPIRRRAGRLLGVGAVAGFEALPHLTGSGTLTQQASLIGVVTSGLLLLAGYGLGQWMGHVRDSSRAILITSGALGLGLAPFRLDQNQLDPRLNLLTSIATGLLCGVLAKKTAREMGDLPRLETNSRATKQGFQAGGEMGWGFLKRSRFALALWVDPSVQQVEVSGQHPAEEPRVRIQVRADAQGIPRAQIWEKWGARRGLPLEEWAVAPRRTAVQAAAIDEELTRWEGMGGRMVGAAQVARAFFLPWSQLQALMDLLEASPDVRSLYGAVIESERRVFIRLAPGATLPVTWKMWAAEEQVSLATAPAQ